MALNLDNLSFMCIFTCILTLNIFHECQTFLAHNDRVGLNPLLDLLHIADKALHGAEKYAETHASKSDAERLNKYPMDCSEIYELNTSSTNGIYKVWPRSRISKGPITVFCNMEDDGGAWTTIQKRGDFDSGKEYFYRDWASYKKGFGDPLKDFWIGNDNIYALTNQRANILKFILSDWEDNWRYAIYDEFWIEDETRNYTMHVTGYRGTAGDSFSFTNGSPFTTRDRDNDIHPNNCAVLFKGAWWYTSCHSSNLNGLYLKGTHATFADGVEWKQFRGLNYSLKDTWIMIRPNDFRNSVKLDLTPQ